MQSGGSARRLRAVGVPGGTRATAPTQGQCEACREREMGRGMYIPSN
jgi:hypothetical protein